MVRLHFFAYALYLSFSLNAMEKIHTRELRAAPSALCTLFGIDPIFCEAPLDVQRLIATKLKTLYSQDIFIHPHAELTGVHKDWSEMHHVRFDKNIKATSQKDGISDFILIRNGKVLVSCAPDGSVAFWNIPAMTLIRELRIVEPLRDFSGKWMRLLNPPERRRSTLAVNDSETLLALSLEDKVYIFELATLFKKDQIDIVLRLGYHAQMVKFLKKNATGDELLIAIPASLAIWAKPPTYNPEGIQPRKGIQVWNVDKGYCMRVFLDGNRQMKRAALSADRTRLAVTYYDNTKDDSEDCYVCLDIYNCTSKEDPIELFYHTRLHHVNAICNIPALCFLDNEHLIVVLNQTSVLLSLNNTFPYKGPFIHATTETIEKIVGALARESDIFFRDESRNDLKGSKPSILVKSLSYDAKNQRLCCALTNRRTDIYDLKVGTIIASYQDPRPFINSISIFSMTIGNQRGDTDVKCLVHPDYPFCFTVAEMEPAQLYDSLHVWIIPPRAFIDCFFSVKTALFWILLNVLKKGRSLSLKKIHFPDVLRHEMISIFRSLPPDQKEFIRLAFLS